MAWYSPILWYDPIMFQRILDLSAILSRKSLFLFGPRQTGKTTYIKSRFPDAMYVDLLDTRVQHQLLVSPHRLSEIIAARRAMRSSDASEPMLIVIDEIQKVPALLDEVHRHIESHDHARFVLTGSSARKLLRSGVNLLGGRAKRVRFHPIRTPERTGTDVSWRTALQWGGLPSILLSDDRRSDLLDYVGLYLQEEIRNEALARSLATFSRFLDVAATTNTEQVVYQSIASDVGVSAPTVVSYYEILEDTLVGERLMPYRRGIKRKSVAAPKFYFFDTGVFHALMRRWNVAPHSAEFGTALEQLVHNEIRAYLDITHREECSLFFWRTQSGIEVDFVVETESGELVAIEVKATRNVTPRHLKPLRRMAEEPEFTLRRRIVACTEPTPRLTDDGILILPIPEFLDMLWSGEMF